MRIRKRTSSPLRKKAKKGFRGYPVATAAFYGPTADKATKVAVGIIVTEGAEPAVLERWFSTESDIRLDAVIMQEILDFLGEHEIKSVVMTDRLIGCPHEEGIDYPEGQSCPECPYWAGRDRWKGDRVH